MPIAIAVIVLGCLLAAFFLGKWEENDDWFTY